MLLSAIQLFSSCMYPHGNRLFFLSVRNLSTGLTQSPGTSSVVLSQLLKVLTPSGHNSSGTGGTSSTGSGGNASNYTASPNVILKALKILRQLAQSGSTEFRSSLARRGKGVLAEAVTYRGQWDEIHGDRLNENIRAAAEVSYRLTFTAFGCI